MRYKNRINGKVFLTRAMTFYQKVHLACINCPSEPFYSYCSLEKHVNSCHKDCRMCKVLCEMKYLCLFCGKTCTRMQVIEKHSITHKDATKTSLKSLIKLYIQNFSYNNITFVIQKIFHGTNTDHTK